MKEDNPKIYATGNENLKGEFNISYYIVEKDKKFLDFLEKLLKEVLDFKESESVKLIMKEVKDEDGNHIRTDIYFKDITKMIDLHEHYQESGERIDLFYGKNRVYMTFRKSKKIRKKFAKFLIKTKEWVKIEEKNELPLYAGKKFKNAN